MIIAGIVIFLNLFDIKTVNSEGVATTSLESKSKDTQAIFESDVKVYTEDYWKAVSSGDSNKINDAVDTFKRYYTTGIYVDEWDFRIKKVSNSIFGLSVHLEQNGIDYIIGNAEELFSSEEARKLMPGDMLVASGFINQELSISMKGAFERPEFMLQVDRFKAIQEKKI